MPHNLPYSLITDLEMVWLDHAALAVGTMLWLNWFCETERSLGLTSPPNNVGMSLAMQVRVDWMINAPKNANFTDDFDDYVSSGTSTSNQAHAVIEKELLRVNTDFDAHNAKQKKRSWDDVVREKLFANMQQTFKGGRNPLRAGKGTPH